MFLVDVQRCLRCGHRDDIFATVCDSRMTAAILDVWKPSAGPFYNGVCCIFMTHRRRASRPSRPAAVEPLALMAGLGSYLPG